MSQAGNYFKILLVVVIGFLAFLAGGLGLFMLLRLLAAGFDKLPLNVYIYLVFLLLVMPSIFMAAQIYFFKRALNQPKPWVKYFTAFLHLIGMACCVYGLFSDYKNVFLKFDADSIRYFTLDIVFIGINIGILLLSSGIQAMAAPPEKDWLDKYKETPAS